jgi:hypothetical protein
MRDCLRTFGSGAAARSVATSPPITAARFQEFVRKSGTRCTTFEDADGFAAVGWSDAMAFARWYGGALPSMQTLMSHARSMWQTARDGLLQPMGQGLFSALPVGSSRRLMAADGFLVLRGRWEWGYEGDATDWGWCYSPSGERAIRTYSVRPSVANEIAGCFRVV